VGALADSLGIGSGAAARGTQHEDHPRRGEIAISGRRLWTWLSRFRRGGIDALHPRHRKDRGSLRAVPCPSSIEPKRSGAR
jgi:hypothetical protein